MLDFTQVLPQIESFSAERARGRRQRESALAEANRRLRESGNEWEKMQIKIAQSRTSWLVARWGEVPNAVEPPAPRPFPCVVLAADGSQIVADRHDIALCYLLNIGRITLRYGTGQPATLTSRPQIQLPEDDLLERIQGDQEAIAPRRVGIRRQLAEFAALAEMISEEKPAVPALALFDGSLILWTLEPEADEFRADSLRLFAAAMQTAQQQRVPVAGYISSPQSRDVVNALRVFRCPHKQANCDRECPGRNRSGPAYIPPGCAGTEGVTDAELFAQRLRPGERSAVFGSASQILLAYPEEQRVRFFYLHTGREIARVEIPAWIADDSGLLAQTHALCYDQAQKGDGYPVALAEAHEQAIVRGAEREAFFKLMERAFITSHQSFAITQKAVSKRARRI